MNLEPINAAIDAAYQAALTNPQNVASQTIAENVFLRTHTYVTDKGNGFRVVCDIRVPSANFTVTRVRGHGPYPGNRDWPTEGIEVAAQNHIKRCVTAGEAHVARLGFTPTRLTSLLRKFIEAQQADTLASKPKLVALYQWTSAVESAAISGKCIFPDAPFTFEEAMTE
jgi:mRNA-degrading endonuclease HigB of HigAB toxin-antitoxin module